MTKERRIAAIFLFVFFSQNAFSDDLFKFINLNDLVGARKHIIRFPKSVNETDMYGMKPMHIVAREGSPEMCLLLRNYAAQVDDEARRLLEYNSEHSGDILDCFEGKTQYQDATGKESEKTPDIEDLIENINRDVRNERYFADSLMCGKSGRDQTSISQKNSDVQINLHLDWKKKCSRETGDLVPCRCLDMSILYGDKMEFEGEISEIDINKRNYYRETPLIVATRNGNFTSVKSLLEYGANPNFQTPSGKTAAHFAAEHGDDGLILLLWLNNALLNTSDDYGKPPQIYAPNSEHSRTKQLIKVLLDPILSKQANWRKVLDGLTNRK